MRPSGTPTAMPTMVLLFDCLSCACGGIELSCNGSTSAVVMTIIVVASPWEFVVVACVVITLVCGGRLEEAVLMLDVEPELVLWESLVELLGELLVELLVDFVELADEAFVDEPAFVEIVAVAVPSSMSMNLTFCTQQDLLASSSSTSGRFLSQQYLPSLHCCTAWLPFSGPLSVHSQRK